MRRLSRQLWAVLSVLRSCVLVKLYSVVSCTSFWTSSRVALAVVSWSTCCCRLSSASLLCQGFERFWTELSPRAATRTIACTLTSLPAYDYYAEYTGERTTGGKEDKGRDQYTVDPDNEKFTRTPQCPAGCGARDGRTIQGTP